MYNYVQIDLVTGKADGISVLASEVVADNLIAIDTYDDRLLMCYYIDGKFEGYYTKLQYDSINKKVVAEIFTYLDERALDYNADIIFDYEGNQIIVQAVNGIATIDFVADAGTTHTVRTVNPTFRNSEVTFSV
ncbi:hypothetical protein [Schinkia azotoformans]|uniref:hypothetical protein n=1 Tax=Schinkia azotoformans TaxID=1454 RepID=UPI002DB64542|nr:hypothetical protein [Schinkia azotoformans]MEC1757360.1 hypothetical protein [Schinkia azotoformans]